MSDSILNIAARGFFAAAASVSAGTQPSAGGTRIGACTLGAGGLYQESVSFDVGSGIRVDLRGNLRFGDFHSGGLRFGDTTVGGINCGGFEI